MVARLATPEARADAIAAAAHNLEAEPVFDVDAGGESHVFFAGGATARDRVWLQFDALADPTAAVAAVVTVLESLSSGPAGRFRQPVLGRARLAIAVPDPLARGGARVAETPQLDTGRIGTRAASMAALRRFQPTVVIHFQDWWQPESGVRRGATGLRADATQPGAGDGQRLRGLRLIESFPMERQLHERLEHPRALRGRFGRPSKLAQALIDHPDAYVGAMTQQHVRRQGYPLEESVRGSSARNGTVVELGSGRYAPRQPFRELGGGNLAELALAEFGASGLTGQVDTGSPLERAGMALAFAEGAVLYRLGFDLTEKKR